MSPETESQRTNRIRNAQMDERNSNTASRSRGAGRKSAAKRQEERWLIAELLGILPGGIRGMVIGVGLAFFPAILGIILLSGTIKILPVILLVVVGLVGFAIGKLTIHQKPYMKKRR